MAELRSAAADLVLGVAKGMTDPAALEGVALASGGRMPSAEADGRPMWDPVSLANGFPGVTLLFAELGHHDPYFRTVAHDYLTAAGRHAVHAPAGGLYSGLTGFAFSARAAAHGPGDYAVLRSRADEKIAEYAASFSGHTRSALADPSRRRMFHEFDVISGMSGVGRHLLDAGPEHAPALEEVLAYLAELTLPRTRHDRQVPGWWVDHGMDFEDNAPGGHGNFGLAHGISGPLALLSLAWQRGHRCEAAHDAVHRIAAWLVQWQQADRHGPFWPTGITTEDLGAGPAAGTTATRPSWCYGTPGIANALRLAGTALGEETWVDTAHAAVQAATERSRTAPVMSQPGLCHGLGGLLVALESFRQERSSEALDGAVEAAVAEIVRRHQPDAPFGFTVLQEGSGLRLDHPGFLDGVTGVLLALWKYATGEPPRSGWDAALLMS
ncbi:lanthionine synthetase C family protein [Streptomyces sp. BR123]|uniref:lanthionine synthetase C family protein n=1 Tax=Streptomyces sp. BR123 TaxID=2749828 RepID=UPI0015C42D1F|nr:lanthionine synthetase C family protein [Streptomyces sp. BR123]NXY95655.1 lanthionine synthetase C family protein [Streptomyces sp. BR123]